MPFLCWTTSWFAAERCECPSGEVDLWADANFSFQEQDRWNVLLFGDLRVLCIEYVKERVPKGQKWLFCNTATRSSVLHCRKWDSFPYSYQPGCEGECMRAPLCMHRISKAGKDVCVCVCTCSCVPYHWRSDCLFPISFLSLGWNPETLREWRSSLSLARLPMMLFMQSVLLGLPGSSKRPKISPPHPTPSPIWTPATPPIFSVSLKSSAAFFCSSAWAQPVHTIESFLSALPNLARIAVMNV